MKIIDAHIHFSNIESFKRTAKEISFLDYSGRGLQGEMEKSNVVATIAMGLTEHSQGGFPDYDSLNPMGVDLEKEMPRSMFYCLGINPVKLQGQDGERELYNIEEQINNDKVIGMKIYAGYYPYYVYDSVYRPVYDLAAKYKMPVYIHSGDTYSERGLLKYSHPLNIDELAVSRRDVNFVICHFGDPWIMDCAEVLSKNYNVYADLSGLIVGDSNVVRQYQDERLFIDHIKRGLVYAKSYNKILFGTDWPLVQIEPYVEFIKYLVPEQYHQDVFYNNAIKLFPKLREFLGEELE